MSNLIKLNKTIKSKAVEVVTKIEFVLNSMSSKEIIAKIVNHLYSNCIEK